MNYLKYTGLFFVIFLGIFVVIVAIFSFVIFNFANERFAIFAIAALYIIALIIIMIVKSNNRVMTFGEIIKYALSFSIPMIIIFITPFIHSGEYTRIFITILLPTLISMFLVNIYFKIRYKNGLESTQAEPKNRKLNRQIVVSIVLFIIFVFGCVLYILESVKTGDGRFIGLGLFIIPYFIYLVISLIVVYFCYKKVLILNIIAILIIAILMGLNATGFCYKTKSFVPNKVAIIDNAMVGHIEYKCKGEKYFREKMGLEEKECSVSFKSIKEEAPHCFTENRPDECRGDITHFDKKGGSIIKGKMLIYRVNEACFREPYGGCNFFDYILSGKRYYIWSELSIELYG